ncbi:MAG: hypothetical protein M3R53_10600 [Candidatus Eremiobacteraeota bacterium]|nr:hypothetical protein [Candidatus Eremiobacteraeota bacterium]
MIETVFVPRGAEERAVRNGLARARADVRVVTTGIGPFAAARAADGALGAHPFGTALVTGLCGLLSPAFAVGDALLYDNVRRAGEAPIVLDRALAASLARRLGGVQTGIRALASDAVVTSHEAKRALGLRYAVDAVDMESYAIAQRLHRARVAVAVLRVGSDAVVDDLPDIYRAFDGSGGIDRFALLLVMLRKPRAGAHLARNGLRALGSLQSAVYAIFRPR